MSYEVPSATMVVGLISCGGLYSAPPQVTGYVLKMMSAWSGIRKSQRVGKLSAFESVAALDTCDFTRGLGNRLERKIELHNQLLASKTWVWWPRVWHRARAGMGAHSGDSDRCFFTKQAARKLVCYLQSCRLHRSQFPHQPRSVSHCRLRSVRRANACVSSNLPAPSVIQKENLPMSKMGLPIKPTLMKTSPPSNARQPSREGVKKKIGRTRGQTRRLIGPTSCWPCYVPMFISPTWFSAPPRFLPAMGSRPGHWRNDLLYRGGDIERTQTRTSFARTGRLLRDIHTAHHCATL